MAEKAQKRAEHNAIERQRREVLNTKFQQLALSLPNLQHDRRPSKGTIIERTLEYGNYISFYKYKTCTNVYLYNSQTNRSKGTRI